MEYLRDVVPEKCLSCPMMVTSSEKIDAMNTRNDRLIMASVGSDTDTIAQEFANTIKQELGEEGVEFPDTIHDEIASQLREMNGDVVARTNAFIETIVHKLGEYSLGCVGPLTMQASMPTDVRRKVQARICMSEKAPQTTTEPVIVKRFTV